MRMFSFYETNERGDIVHVGRSDREGKLSCSCYEPVATGDDSILVDVLASRSSSDVLSTIEDDATPPRHGRKQEAAESVAAHWFFE